MRACFVIALVFASLLNARGQSVKQIGHWSAALFSVLDLSDNEKKSDQDHAAALRFVHSTSKAKLASDLEKVFDTYGLNTVEGAGAAYLMAMHGIDVSKNLSRLERIKQFDNKHTWKDDCVESMPGAYADIASRLNSSRAAHDLLAMDTDGFVGEDQGIEVCTLFLSSPDLIVNAASLSKKLSKSFLSAMGYGADNYDSFLSDTSYRQNAVPMVHKIAKRHLRTAKGAALSIYKKLAYGKPTQWGGD